MKWLIAILTAFFKALLPWVAKQSRPTAQVDAAPTRHQDATPVRKHFQFAFVRRSC